MRWLAAMGVVLCLGGPACLESAEIVARVDASTDQVRAMRQASQLLLHVDDSAGAFGWIAKVSTPGKLLVLCREADGGVCVPVRLETIETHATDDGLFVQASALTGVLGFSIDDSGNAITLRREKPAAATRSIPAYHADWGPGRGFDVGQTLPDIPLYDMQGGEVRFSQFLGKQSIIYAWASW